MDPDDLPPLDLYNPPIEIPFGWETTDAEL